MGIFIHWTGGWIHIFHLQTWTGAKFDSSPTPAHARLGFPLRCWHDPSFPRPWQLKRFPIIISNCSMCFNVFRFKAIYSLAAAKTEHAHVRLHQNCTEGKHSCTQGKHSWDITSQFWVCIYIYTVTVTVYLHTNLSIQNCTQLKTKFDFRRILNRLKLTPAPCWWSP